MTWERLKQLPLLGRIVLALIAALFLYEFVLQLAAPFSSGGGGSGRTTLSTKADGLAAYSALLERAGHPVERAGGDLADEALSNGATVIVAGRALDDDDVSAMKRFVARGGRLVLVGGRTADAAEQLVGSTIEHEDDAFPPNARVLAPVAETVGVGEVSGHNSHWIDTGAALPVLGTPNGAYAAVADVGPGRVVLVADVSPLDNASLGNDDNAAFGLAIAGDPRRPVIFAEAGRSAATGRGFEAMPRQWRWALLAGLVAALLAMWSAGRRFGPPEDEARELPPPRKAYVDALASTLARTKQPERSLAPLRTAAVERLRRRAALGVDATEPQLRKAAADMGLSKEEADALFGAVTGDESALAVGRAMARLGGTEW